MIRVYLRFYGNLIRYKDSPMEKEKALDIPPGSRVGDIASTLGIRRKEAQMLQCNGSRIDWDFRPAEGDRISFYSLMSGG